MHTENMFFYNSEWGIIAGILYSYTGENKENVVVPDGIKSIDSNPFKETIETLKMPKSLIELKPSINAKKVHIFGNTKINFNVVNVREKIKELVIYNNDNEETILNNLKQKIEKPYYLTNLKRITLRGKPIKEEYNDEFELMKEKLSKLDIDLTLPKEFEIIDGILTAYNGEETNLVIPEGVRIIDANAFRGCRLTNIILPESLETIKDKAFADNNLEKIVIPPNINFISYGAFLHNPNLKIVEMPSKNLLNINMPYIEHLILSNGNVVDIKNVLKLNEEEFLKLKKLTLKNSRLNYFYLKSILEKVRSSNIEVQICDENTKGNTYTFIDGKLNNIIINSSEYGYLYTEALEECYKIYINNTNGNGIKNFIEHIKTFRCYKPKNLGMIIIKGQNISLREKLELNKALGKILFYSFEPSEETEKEEEIVEIDNSLEDEEISKLLTEINSILNNNTNNEDKNKILFKINNILNRYKQNLTKLKPKLFNEQPKFGEEELTPDRLRMNLILELNDILTRLKSNNIYLKLRKSINYFESLIQNKEFLTSNEIKTLEDKVKYIISKSNLYKKYNFTNVLQRILEEINRQISNNIISLKNDIELVNETPIEQDLDDKVDELYEEVKRITIIEELFNSEDSDLVKDINKIKTIISNFSIEHKDIYSKKLNNIINKYYQELIDGKRTNIEQTQLELRKAWHPLLEELNINAHILVQYRELIDELNNEKNDRISTIEILVNEINNIKDSNNLDEVTKVEINNKLERIITSWKNKLVNNYEVKEESDPLEEVFKNCNLLYIPKLKINNTCIEIEIEIAKELLYLKNEILSYIEKQEEYEKLTKTMKNMKISG